MKRWKYTLGWLAIVIMFSVPMHAAEETAPEVMAKSVSAARVADHENTLRLEVGPYLELTFEPDTFSEDTAVAAHLDVEKRTLTITTRGGDVSRAPANIRLALPDLEGGLQIVYDHQTDGGSWLEGTLIDRADEPMPQIVALMSDVLEPVAIDNSTVVLLAENKQRPQRIRWTDLAYGDHIQVRYGRGRRASSVEATRVTGEGVIESVTNERFKLVGATSSLVVNPHARFEDAEGEQFDFESLRPKDRITLRIDPQTREVWQVTRVEAAQQEEPMLVVTHDGTGNLLPGDRVRITGTGPPGGTLTIDIVSVESNLRATELTSDPGTYVLTYTIPRGVSLEETPIVARLDLPNRPSHTVLAEMPLVFTASAAGDVSAEAQDQEKPEPPVVASPQNGDTIENSITVTGTAAPNQKVQITIDYRVTKSIVLLGEGQLVETEVSTDSDGFFTTKEIPAEVQSLFGGNTDYTITVTTVSRGGVESDPTMVQVRRPD